MSKRKFRDLCIIKLADGGYSSGLLCTLSQAIRAANSYSRKGRIGCDTATTGLVCRCLQNRIAAKIVLLTHSRPTSYVRVSAIKLGEHFVVDVASGRLQNTNASNLAYVETPSHIFRQVLRTYDEFSLLPKELPGIWPLYLACLADCTDYISRFALADFCEEREFPLAAKQARDRAVHLQFIADAMNVDSEEFRELVNAFLNTPVSECGNSGTNAVPGIVTYEYLFSARE